MTIIRCDRCLKEEPNFSTEIRTYKLGQHNLSDCSKDLCKSCYLNVKTYFELKQGQQ